MGLTFGSHPAADTAWRNAPQARRLVRQEVVVEDGGARARRPRGAARLGARVGGVGVGARGGAGGAAEPQAALAASAGAPAAREHAKRGRELDAARAQLAALRAADGHAHEVATDDAAAARRPAEAAEFRLRQVDEVAAARAADNKRLISDLHKGQAELAAERKQRFQYADRLRVLEARQAEKDASKENAARAAASPVLRAVWARRPRRSRRRRPTATRRGAPPGDDRDALVAVARAIARPPRSSSIVRAALAATAAVAPLAGDEKGDREDGGSGAAPVDGWNHHLVVERVQALCEERRELVARSETWKEHELAKAFSERGTREATERAEKAEAELAATKAALAAAEAAAAEGQRYKEFPVGTAEADLREAEAALADVRNGEARCAGALRGDAGGAAPRRARRAHRA